MPHTNAIDSQVLDLMLRAGSSWVLYLLLGLSVAAVAVMIERLWFFLRERRPAAALREALVELRQGNASGALARLADAPSMEAAVARECLRYAADGPAAVDERKAGAIE